MCSMLCGSRRVTVACSCTRQAGLKLSCLYRHWLRLLMNYHRRRRPSRHQMFRRSLLDQRLRATRLPRSLPAARWYLAPRGCGPPQSRCWRGALSDRLRLSRALRPFRRRWPSSSERELDEARTAEMTAELGGQLHPVFGPRGEPHGLCHAPSAGVVTSALRIHSFWWSLVDAAATNVHVPAIPLVASDWHAPSAVA